MLESAVYLFGVDLLTFWRLFLDSHVSDDFGHGLSGTVSGKSGWELASEILDDAGIKFERETPKGLVGRSREFWAGWVLAQYQWHSGVTFREIESFASMKDLLLMYSPYHEMGIDQFIDAIEVRRLQASEIHENGNYLMAKDGIDVGCGSRQWAGSQTLLGEVKCPLG